MAEISDDQLAVFQRGMALLQEASTKPETRRDFERLVKKLRPDVETTDDIAANAAAPYVERIEAATSRIDDFIAAQAKQQADALEAQSDRLRDEAFGRLRQDGYTDDGLGAIKQLMVDRNIADPEAAAALFDRMNPKPIEGTSSWEPPAWDLRGNAVERDVDGLFQNADAWADKEVYNVLKDIRSSGGSN